MPTASLNLSTLQISWLTELQVAAPFIAPYRTKESPNTENKADRAIATHTLENKETGVMSARQALSDSLAELRPKKASAPVFVPPANEPVAPPSQAKDRLQPELPSELTQMDLMQLQAYANRCQACSLHEQRVQSVLGAGQINQPDWMVISTAPSSNEEISGLPMQGKSGELFTAQMQSIGVDVSHQLYLTQLLKCRAATKPIPEQLVACQPILWRQIELIQPKRLLVLGSKAASLFLGEGTPFEGLRGQVHQWQDPKSGRHLPVVVSYHPASILLRPQLKAQSWGDVLLMKQLMGS